MACATLSPLGALARGLLAGAAGTAAMDLYWYCWYRRGGGTSGVLEWEFSAGLTDWEKAPAPAQVGKRLYEGFFQRPLPAARAALTNNAMHWAYGTLRGGLYGLVAATVCPPRIPSGVAFGTWVFASDYVILPMANLYKPIWQYDAATLAKDLGSHLVYGVATAIAFRASAAD
jgi:hypothetical protein